MTKVTTPRPAPTRGEHIQQDNIGNKEHKAFKILSWGFWILFVIFIFGLLFFGLKENDEHARVHTFIQTICLVEGYPDHRVIKDNQNHWRGFCINAIESVEIPMHPDLNLDY